MVPFWKRRLLIAAVPCTAIASSLVLAVVLMAAAGAGHQAVGRSHAPGLVGWRYALGLSLSAMILPVLSLAALARPSFHERLGPAFWISSACLLAHTLLLLSYLAFGAVLTIDLTAGEGREIQFGVAGVVAAVTTILLARGIARVRPRETAIARLAGRMALLGLGLTAVMVPAFIAELAISAAGSQGVLGYSLTDYHLITAIGSLMLWAALALLSTGAWASVAARVLAGRHAGFRSRHCPSCGYNLAGIELAACPECGAALAGVQSRTRPESESGSNGSQAISSSPI